MTSLSSEPLVNLDSDELVAVAWIASIDGFNASFVATQLPEPADAKGQPASWVTTPPYGFVTVSVVGGSEDPLLPIHRPVMQVDCWALRPGSGKPPWNTANRLASHIIAASRNGQATPRRLTISANGVDYPAATVQGAKALTSPRRILDDAGDFAHYSLDLWLQWITVSEVFA